MSVSEEDAGNCVVFGSMVVLTLGGMLVIPNWVLQNIWEILNYPAYNPAGSIADVIGNWFPGMGSIVKWVISGSLGLLLVYEWWIARKQEFHWFLWTVCITLLISQWIGIQTDPGNFIVLFTPFVMVIAFLEKVEQVWECRSCYFDGYCFNWVMDIICNDPKL